MASKNLIVTSKKCSYSTKQTALDILAFINGIKESSSSGTREVSDLLYMHESPGAIYFETTKRTFDTPGIWITNHEFTLKCRSLFTFAASELLFETNFSKQRGNFVFFDKNFDNGHFLIAKKVLFDVFKGDPNPDADFDVSDSNDLTANQTTSTETQEIKVTQDATISEIKDEQHKDNKNQNSEENKQQKDEEAIYAERLQNVLNTQIWDNDLYNNHVESARTKGCDKILSFFILENKIWLRAYVIDGEIKEIGPRMVFEIEKIFKGALKGELLYKDSNRLSFVQKDSLQIDLSQNFKDEEDFENTAENSKSEQTKEKKLEQNSISEKFGEKLIKSVDKSKNVKTTNEQSKQSRNKRGRPAGKKVDEDVLVKESKKKRKIARDEPKISTKDDQQKVTKINKPVTESTQNEFNPENIISREKQESVSKREGKNKNKTVTELEKDTENKENIQSKQNKNSNLVNEVDKNSIISFTKEAKMSKNKKTGVSNSVEKPVGSESKDKNEYNDSTKLAHSLKQSEVITTSLGTQKQKDSKNFKKNKQSVHTEKISDEIPTSFETKKQKDSKNLKKNKQSVHTEKISDQIPTSFETKKGRGPKKSKKHSESTITERQPQNLLIEVDASKNDEKTKNKTQSLGADLTVKQKDLTISSKSKKIKHTKDQNKDIKSLPTAKDSGGLVTSPEPIRTIPIIQTNEKIKNKKSENIASKHDQRDSKKPIEESTIVQNKSQTDNKVDKKVKNVEKKDKKSKTNTPKKTNNK